MELRQAVILCGGLGTRLKPLTNNIPKPMVDVNGRPFLSHLIDQLKENGFTEIILLTGYKKEVIEDYYGDGSNFGIKIKYSRGDVDWDTGRRLYKARDMIQDHFFLMYCDNFVQFRIEKLKKFYQKKNVLVTCIIYSKESNNNMEVRDDGMILNYDKKRLNPNLKYVELGCMIIDKKVFSLFDDSNFSFSRIIKELSDKRDICGYLIKDPYYSISDPVRLKLTQEYLSEKKIIILDRDGIINKKAPKGDYISTWEQFEFTDGLINNLKLLADKGYSFIIVTNQAGIARGKYTKKDFITLTDRLLLEFQKNNINVLKVYHCPHHWDEKCECRKPEPGMLIQASKDFRFRLDKTYFIGDDERDVLAAFRCNARSILVGDDYSKEWLDKYLIEFECKPDYNVSNVQDAISIIEGNVDNKRYQ